VGERYAPTKIVLRLSAADVAARAPDVRGHAGFFPAEAFDPTGERPRGRPFRLSCAAGDDAAALVREGGLGAPVRLRGGEAFERWWERQGFRPGDELILERGRGRAVSITSEREVALPAAATASTRDEPSFASPTVAAGDAPGPALLDLYAGCGGAALGFRAAGFRIVEAVELDPVAAETYRTNLDAPTAVDDVARRTRFPEADVLIAGPPSGGLGALDDAGESAAAPQFVAEFLRVLATVRPAAFCFENVAPLLRSPACATLLETARALGYGAAARVLNAADYGVPQTRKRAVVLGLFGAEPSFPAPTHVDPELRDLTTFAMPPWRTVRDAIADLPHLPDGANGHVARDPTSQSRERYAFIPPGGNRFDLPPRLTPECWKRRTTGATDVFGRLRWDRPAVTIRTEFYKPEKGRYLHPVAHRAITPREAARLQGFPDHFRFSGSLTATGLQIGSAFPPPLAEALAKTIRASLALAAPRARRMPPP
jgi:DNA (cytosine-5)-methyltransferase 1